MFLHATGGGHGQARDVEITLQLCEIVDTAAAQRRKIGLNSYSQCHECSVVKITRSCAIFTTGMKKARLHPEYVQMQNGPKRVNYFVAITMISTR
jgi:hypothetical protein